ncbi:MAG: DMT family transporter [Verrucomicrobia bacterium]|nr:DMT family transporter [Verrucomicrobiota bacterium]
MSLSSASQPPPPPRWKVVTYLTIGLMAMASSSLLVRAAFNAAPEQSTGISLTLGAGRLFLASLFLLPSWIVLLRRPAQDARALWLSLASGVLLALHFATWFTSLLFTSVTASLILVTLGPVWTAILGAWLKIERITPLTWLGVGLAFAGALVIGFADATPSATSGSNPLLGDALALLGGIAVAGYRLLGRAAQHRGLSIGEYSAVAYGSGGLALLPWPGLLAASGGAWAAYAGLPAAFYAWMIALAVIPQLIGHTSANWAIRWFSPTLVSLLILFEPVIASVVVWVLFGEKAGLWVWIGGAITLLGVVLAAQPEKREAGKDAEGR